MLWAEAIWGLIALALLLDIVRIRRRWNSIEVLGEGSEPSHSDHRFVLAPGVVLDDETRAAAHAHREKRSLDVLDLVPGTCRLATAWSLGCHLDPETQRANPLAFGDTGAHAMLAPIAVLDALGVGDTVADLASFVSVAREVRRRAQGQTDFAIVPRLEATNPNPFFDGELLRVRLGGSIGPVSVGVPFVWSLLVLGLVVAPWAGLVALVAHHIQQPLALRAPGLTIGNRWGQALLRIPVDGAAWIRLISGQAASLKQVEALRTVYSVELSEGLDRFFEPVRTDCSLCGSSDLGRGFDLSDLHQGKPGRFHLSHCRQCGHWFQNPRLNSDGLSFYYRDFYDGLNEAGLDLVFGSTVRVYRQRIEMVMSHIRPERWLDVGCGHGHMFAHARSALQDTCFEGLDMGNGIEAGLARGWLDVVHRGMFGDCAPGMEPQYDVVSMFHYLEHTTDPRTELSAAHQVLRPGGFLVIEVPDPDSPFARLLGRWWMPWYQPQHLNLLSTVNLARELRDAGFEPVDWQTGGANAAHDLALGFYLMVQALTPKIDVPWLPPTTRLDRLWHRLVWIPGMVFVAVGAVLDNLLHPLVRRLHHSSQFRVVARRRGSGG